MASSFLYDVNTITTIATMNLDNTTADIGLFTVTGPIALITLWGVVTTDISSSHTAGFVRATSGAGVSNITASGVSLASDVAGDTIYRTGLVANAFTELTGGVGASTGTSLETSGPIFIGHVTGQTSTTIAYRHTTTNTPETGAIQFYMQWVPLTPTSTVVTA